MGKLEVRVTSVQIVTGFPAHVIIPEPPGWQPACNADNGIGPGATTWGPHTPPVTYGNKGNTPCTDYVSADEKRTTKGDNLSYTLNFENASAAGSAMSIGDSTVISQAHQSTKATHYTELGNEKLENDASVSTDAEIGRFTFNSRKLKGENAYLNYLVHRGPWIDQPPPSLKLDSCMDGPIIYVNEVINKNVSQIWHRTVDGWVSVKEGHAVFTARERKLGLDKQQIPHLLAVRHKLKQRNDQAHSDSQL